jgi:hypothetical protein
MQEMQRIMENMKPTVLFIYENMLRLWFIIQSIILGLRFFAPKINDFLWDFNEALQGNYDDIYNQPASPKKPVIDNAWCNVDPTNILETKRKSEDNLLKESDDKDKNL